MELVGRDRELTDIAGRLAAGTRLVTVVGPGGIGKTALATAALRHVASNRPARTVELARLDRADGVTGAVAAGLGFTSFDVLLQAHQDSPSIVLLDNCEHVADAAADAVTQLLTAVDGLAVLATSRSPLGIAEESIVVLGPLAVPPRGGAASDVSAVRLFCNRARDAGVTVEDSDLELVGELCRRLDGIPLAIELAAARLRVVSLAEMVDLLDEGVGVLRRSRTQRVERHRSLHDTVAWSTQLLDDETRAAFRRLAVCAGPFTRETARAVVFGPHASTETSEVLEVLERLVDASLIVAQPGAGATRYRMLEPIRAYALAELAAVGEAPAARDRLASYACEWTIETLAIAAVRWDGDLLPTVLERFDQLDTAIRHCLANDADPERALTMYSALWGVVHQARIDEVLELGALVTERWPDLTTPYRTDTAATFAMGLLLCGHTDAAVATASAALPYAEASSFAPVCLRRVLGLAARVEGDHARAAMLLEEAARSAAAHGVRTMDLECRVYAAQDLAVLGRVDEALATVREVAAEARRLESILNEVWARTVEAAIIATHDRASARRIATRTLSLAESIAYPFGIVCNLQTLAACDLRAGDLRAAAVSADRLLDAVARSGAGDLRRALDVTITVLQAAGDESTGDLAATAARLPDTNPMIFIADPVTDEGRALERSEAVRLARRRLAGVRATGEFPRDRSRPVTGAHGSDGAAAAVFRRTGDLWRVRFEGVEVHLKPSKGMDDLAKLLSRPGDEIHCIELAGVTVEEPSVGEIIDETARRRYEARVRELQAEIDEADDHRDPVRAERARVELDQLVDHLTAALGLTGRTRKQGGTAERVRSAVTHRIRSTVRRIAAVHPSLGRHLDASLTTGVYCRYRPERPVDWHT